MNGTRKTSSARLIEFTIVAVVFGMITSAAVPALLESRLSANEAAAIATLRSIAAAQRELKAAVEIDTDCDGIGEYGYLAELAGTTQMRICTAGYPAAGTVAWDMLFPPLLPPPFGQIQLSTAKDSGYRFKMWLPSLHYVPTNWVVGFPEDDNGGKTGAPFPDPDTGALYWCCYAWPINAGVTGDRAFFINEEGIVLECANHGSTPYSGLSKTPDFGEAYQHRSNMASGLRIGPPRAGHDGTIWNRVWE